MTKSINLHFHYTYMTLCVCMRVCLEKDVINTQIILCICLNLLKDESMDGCVNYSRSLTVLVVTFTSFIDVHRSWLSCMKIQACSYLHSCTQMSLDFDRSFDKLYILCKAGSTEIQQTSFVSSNILVQLTPT